MVISNIPNIRQLAWQVQWKEAIKESLSQSDRLLCARKYGEY